MSKPFNAEAIPKCRDRLNKAASALFKCRSSQNITAFSSAWAEFLIHTGGVLNALDAGYKTTPQGRQYYGKVKRLGRADELVSYMHQARNAEEHDTKPTSEHQHGHVAIGAPGESVHISQLRVDQEFYRDPVRHLKGRAFNMKTGGLPTIEVREAGPALKTITDQYGGVYQPPTSHAGKKITDKRPTAIAGLYIAYLEGLIADAERLS